MMLGLLTGHGNDLQRVAAANNPFMWCDARVLETYSWSEIKCRLRRWRHALPRFSLGHLGGQTGCQAAQGLPAAHAALPSRLQMFCDVRLQALIHEA